MHLPTLKLKRGREESMLRKHPWIFSGAVASDYSKLNDGEVVKIVSADNNFIALAHYNYGRSIIAKILSFEEEEIDNLFFQKRLSAALSLRKSFGIPSLQTNTFRLVNAEGDYLPGLVIDIYGDVAVIETQSTGMSLKLNHIASALDAIYPVSTIVYRAGDNVTLVKGDIKFVEVLENGHKFEVDLFNSQKTGFFIDQRDNRGILSGYVKGKDVLNCFSFTGGFSVYAFAGGANSVSSLDISASALDLAQKNFLTNFPQSEEKHEIIQKDCFDYLASVENKFDLIILDPPAFAKKRESVKNALSGYKKLNQMGIKAVKKPGIVFTFSCSQLISEVDFKQMILGAVINSGESVQILKHLSASSCHPINACHNEGGYLKGMILKVG